jgi:hypothetical protein
MEKKTIRAIKTLKIMCTVRESMNAPAYKKKESWKASVVVTIPFGIGR